MTGPPGRNAPRTDDLGDDEVLLSLLGAVLRRPSDPGAVPRDAVARAKSAWNDVELDVELATLLLDSLLDETAALTRHDPAEPVESRSLVFEGADGRRIEVELCPEDEVLGQLSPPRADRIELQSTEGSVWATADELGRFRFDLPGGPLRLLAKSPDGPDLRTPWISR